MLLHYVRSVVFSIILAVFLFLCHFVSPVEIFLIVFPVFSTSSEATTSSSNFPFMWLANKHHFSLFRIFLLLVVFNISESQFLWLPGISCTVTAVCLSGTHPYFSQHILYVYIPILRSWLLLHKPALCARKLTGTMVKEIMTTCHNPLALKKKSQKCTFRSVFRLLYFE